MSLEYQVQIQKEHSVVVLTFQPNINNHIQIIKILKHIYKKRNNNKKQETSSICLLGIKWGNANPKMISFVKSRSTKSSIKVI